MRRSEYSTGDEAGRGADLHEHVGPKELPDDVVKHADVRAAAPARGTRRVRLVRVEGRGVST